MTITLRCLAAALLIALVNTAHSMDLALDPADAAEVFEIGSIQITDPWAKSSIGGGHEAKLFFEFRNLGPRTDRLIGARTRLATGPTRLIAVTADATGRKLKILSAIDIPVSAQPFEMTEVGYYVEVTGLEVPILMGKRFAVDLIFEHAGKVAVDFVARFHSPKLTRRIRAAAARGDIEALKALRPSP